MVTTSNVAFAEQWINHYKNTQSPVTYQAFDFQTIKRTLIEYLQIYHPEYYNNLIETDELLPLIELFAYVGDLFSYRADMNTQEHILSNVTRKSSGIQLANMIGYTVSRRTPAMGLLKIKSLRTTELILDSTGVNLKNQTIYWADQVNPSWQTHFFRILDRILSSQSGIVTARDRTSIAGVTVERYAMNTTDSRDGIIKYSAVVNGVTFPMELVSAELENGSIVEERPSIDRPLSILYMNDGLGNGSKNTGYFILTKQGVLTKYRQSYTKRQPNLVQQVASSGINDSDVWLNEVNVTDKTTSVRTKWGKVDNVAYNDSSVRTVYQLQTLENDGINLIFGDGTYADIPSGTFDCWARTSVEYDGAIPTSSIQNHRINFEYLDLLDNLQTVTVELSLETPITTSSSSETLDKIKSAAPGVFYTQQRMVNAQDYHAFLMQDPSVLKTKAVNRTFAGHSKYKGWYDGSQLYENVRIFGSDGVLYFEPDTKLVTVPNPNSSVAVETFYDQFLEPVLSRPDLWLHVGQRLSINPTYRKFFTLDEKILTRQYVDALVEGAWVGLNWNETIHTWIIGMNPNTLGANDIEIQINVTGTIGWVIFVRSTRVVLHSATTKFWNYGVTSGVIDYDTLTPTPDRLVVLEANSNKNRTGTLDSEIEFLVVNNYIAYNELPSQSLVDLSRIEIIGADVNGDVFPDDLFVDQFIGRELTFAVTPNTKNVTLIFPFTVIMQIDNLTTTDITLVEGNMDDPKIIEWVHSVPSTNVAGEKLLANGVVISDTLTHTNITVYVNEYVYFYGALTAEPTLVDSTDEVKWSFQQGVPGYTRKVGRSKVNFLWQHFTDQYDLVDPAKTNINDLFIVTKGYYSELLRWLYSTDYTALPPELPTHEYLAIAYSKYLNRGVLSDEIVLRPARFKILFGPRSRNELRSKIQLVVRGQTVSNITVKTDVVRLVRRYFDVTKIDFGQTFFFSDLSRYVTSNVNFTIASMLVVPLFPIYQFGDLYQLESSADELFIADINNSDVEIVENITELNIRQW